MSSLENYYIPHDPEVRERFLKALDGASHKARSRVNTNLAVFDIDRFIYYIEVWKYTEMVEGLVLNNHLRGSDYHLDHIIPLSYGFTYNIPSIIIGGFFNLQVITRGENGAKGDKVTPHAEELLSKINYDKTFYPKPTRIVYDVRTGSNNYMWEERQLPDPKQWHK